ncbi:hypothetical protein MBRA_06363 [Methylobacterium brachiatum]|nr:hypothetical protein MBRA_06363 [Methylobacterium brachiatum]
MPKQHRQSLATLAGLIAAATVAGSAWAMETTTPGADTGWSWKEAVTLAVAVLGAVLGLMNTWNAISARRVRLVVKTTFAYSLDALEAPFMAGIEVINLSAFAVTVTEVGFTLRGTTHRAASSFPRIIDGKPWPRRLEAREAVSAYVDPPRDSEFEIRAAYAHLASGETITGKGPAIKNLRAALAQERA